MAKSKKKVKAVPAPNQPDQPDTPAAEKKPKAEKKKSPEQRIAELELGQKELVKDMTALAVLLGQTFGEPLKTKAAEIVLQHQVKTAT